MLQSQMSQRFSVLYGLTLFRNQRKCPLLELYTRLALSAKRTNIRVRVNVQIVRIYTHKTSAWEGRTELSLTRMK